MWNALSPLPASWESNLRGWRETSCLVGRAAALAPLESSDMVGAADVADTVSSSSIACRWSCSIRLKRVSSVYRSDCCSAIYFFCHCLFPLPIINDHEAMAAPDRSASTEHVVMRTLVYACDLLVAKILPSSGISLGYLGPFGAWTNLMESLRSLAPLKHRMTGFYWPLVARACLRAHYGALLTSIRMKMPWGVPENDPA